MPVFTTSKPKLTFGLREDAGAPVKKEVEKKLAKGAKVLEQTGTVKDLKRDATRTAKLPGKRISKSGKEYWETRKNRSDAPNKAV